MSMMWLFNSYGDGGKESQPDDYSVMRVDLLGKPRHSGKGGSVVEEQFIVAKVINQLGKSRLLSHLTNVFTRACLLIRVLILGET